MSAAMKSIYATITNHVQMVGYREIVEAHSRARGFAGFVFNDVDGSVKVMSSGPEPIFLMCLYPGFDNLSWYRDSILILELLYESVLWYSPTYSSNN